MPTSDVEAATDRRMLLEQTGKVNRSRLCCPIRCPIALNGSLVGHELGRIWLDERCRGRDLNPHGPRATRF
jgi:hypothetical protein